MFDLLIFSIIIFFMFSYLCTNLKGKKNKDKLRRYYEKK